MGRVLVPVNLPALPLIVVWAGMVWMSGCIHRRMAGAAGCRLGRDGLAERLHPPTPGGCRWLSSGPGWSGWAAAFTDAWRAPNIVRPV